MDLIQLRTKFKELQILGTEVIEQLKGIEDSDAAHSNALEHFDQFLHLIDTAISSSEARQQRVAKTAAALDRFLHITSPNDDIEALMLPHKQAAAECLQNLNDDTAVAAIPFVLFISVVEDNDIDLSGEESDIIGDVFGHRLVRPLYQGKFTISNDKTFDTTIAETIETVESVETVETTKAVKAAESVETAKAAKAVEPVKAVKAESKPRIQKPTAPAAAPPEERKLNYTVRTAKENSSFSTKAFVSEYSLSTGRRKTSIVLNPSRVGEMLLLHIFARIGAVTRRQLENYSYNEKISDASLERVIKNGFVSSIKFENSENEFFALSAKGTEAFYRETSKNVLSNAMVLPPTLWNTANTLPQMEPDITGYEHMVTVALCFAKAVAGRGIMTLISRINIDAPVKGVNNIIEINTYQIKPFKVAVPFILLNSAGKLQIASAKASALLDGDMDGSITDCIGDTDIYTCNVAEDGIGVVFKNANGDVVDIKSQLNERTHDDGDDDDDDDIGYADDEPGLVDMPSDDTAFSGTGSVKSGSVKIGSIRGGYAKANFAKIHSLEPAVTQPAEEPQAPSVLLAEKLLKNEKLTPAQREPFDALVGTLISESYPHIDSAGRAAVLMKALSASNAIYTDDYKRLLLATDIPIDTRNYSSTEILTLFGEQHEGTVLHLAALLRALFCPDSQYDYSLFQYAEGVLKGYDAIFAAFPDHKRTLSAFLDIHSTLPGGFTDRITGRFVGAQEKAALLKRLTAEADVLKTPPRISQRINGIPEMLAECFGKDSLLGICMGIIASNRMEERADVLEVYDTFHDSGRISKEKIQAVYDESWRHVRTPHMVPAIVGNVRDRIMTAFMERLDVVERWLNCTNSETASSVERQLTSKIQAAISDSLKTPGAPGSAMPLLGRMFQIMFDKLSGKPVAEFLAEDWLSGGVLFVESGMPVAYGMEIPYCEPWRNVLRHIAQTPRAFESVLDSIETPGDPLYDNLGQAIAICNHINDPGRGELYRKSIPNAQKAAEAYLTDFTNGVKVDYAFSRIDEATSETVLIALEGMRPKFWETSNFGQMRAFVGELKHILRNEIERNFSIWSAEIKKRKHKKDGPDELLTRAERMLQSENANFIMVEETLNNYDGNASVDSDVIVSDEEKLFEQFIADSNFDELLRVCQNIKGRAFRDHAPAYAVARTEKAGRSSRYVNSARALASSLPNKPQEDGAIDMKRLLEELGFRVMRVERTNMGGTPAIFKAHMVPEEKNMATYRHPIAEMGTRIAAEFTVIELFGSVEPESIMGEVRKADSRHMPIVFLNGSLNLAQRRQLAKLFLRDGKAANPFVLVDWVLLLHLASMVRDDRQRAMLACSLPYTGIKQLFSMTSTMPIADEMYIGRSDEISQILDMNGPVIVYGGRQLGKTALLQRAGNRFHMPAAHSYSVFIDAKNCAGESEFARLAYKELDDIGIKLPEPDTVSALCDGLRAWFKQQNGRRLLMLVDEADKLLFGLAESEYAPLTPLEDLCRVAAGNFKFVFAGLHNVFLAAKQPNTIFGHFGSPLCIRPMSRLDAYKLLARPLGYLGFAANPDMLLRLLVNTNFYPGVVHFVGSQLIDMLMNNYHEHFNDKKHPPYELTERQIGSIMGMTALTSCIEERIRMTLEVDPAYLTLSRCIGLLYYLESEKRSRGYTPDEIFDCAADIGVESLYGMIEGVHVLYELCDMSILVEKDGFYKFRQLRFLNIIGKSGEEILEQLLRAEEAEKLRILEEEEAKERLIREEAEAERRRIREEEAEKQRIREEAEAKERRIREEAEAEERRVREEAEAEERRVLEEAEAEERRVREAGGEP